MPSRPSTAPSPQVASAPPACALPIRAFIRCCTPSSCSASSQTASELPICASISRLSTDAIQPQSRKPPSPTKRRLRLHGLIERVCASFRYRVTDRGFRVALFFTRIYNRILRPGSADLLLNLGALAKILNRACARFDAKIKTMIDQASFAPQNLTHLHQVSFVKHG